MRTAAALLVLVLLLFLNPAVVAAAPPAARMDLAVLLWESAGCRPLRGRRRLLGCSAERRRRHRRGLVP